MEYKAAQNVHKCALRCPQKVMRLFHFSARLDVHNALAHGSGQSSSG